MIDIDYYLKIQNAYGTSSAKEVKRHSIKKALNRDFGKTLDMYTVTIDGEKQDLTIIRTNDLTIKKIKSRPDEHFLIGQIVEWMDSYWIITEVDSADDIITYGKMTECNYVLHWQDDAGRIISKHAYVEDYTKYSNGETGNSTITVGDNQYGVIVPIDDDTRSLKRGTRMAFDFEDAKQPDIYSLTNRKVALSNYGEIGKGGTILFTFSFASFNSTIDKLVQLDDGSSVWICGYKEEKHDGIHVSIIGDPYINYMRKKTWTVSFESAEHDDFSWKILSKYPVASIISDNQITVTVEDESLIGEDLTLQIVDRNDIVLAELKVDIHGGF